MKKRFIRIIAIVLAVMFLGFSFFSFLNEEERAVDKGLIPKRITIKPVKEIDTVEILQNPVLEVSGEELFQVEEIPEAAVVSDKEKDEILRDKIFEQLEMKMHFVYNKCKKINTQKGIVRMLNETQYADVFLSDFHGNTFYGSNDKEDINARTIILEEIQKVRKYGGGFIVSEVDHRGTKRYILLKNLELNDLFLGVDIYSKAF